MPTSYKRGNREFAAKVARRADELRAARIMHTQRIPSWLFNCLLVLVRAFNIVRRAYL